MRIHSLQSNQVQLGHAAVFLVNLNFDIQLEFAHLSSGQKLVPALLKARGAPSRLLTKVRSMILVPRSTTPSCGALPRPSTKISGATATVEVTSVTEGDMFRSTRVTHQDMDVNFLFFGELLQYTQFW